MLTARHPRLGGCASSPLPVGDVLKRVPGVTFLSDVLEGPIDSTDIYRALRTGLFP